MALSGTQRHSVALSGNYRGAVDAAGVAIRGNQWQSEAITAEQWTPQVRPALRAS